ncbi:hypothetical protein AB0G85_33870 [Streptomyces sioyaensis]|uniref:hypothetical protein n=1 Tax=Streptomyces sioyaensis TaxID=67364 RepID=UPI0033C7A6F8
MPWLGAQPERLPDVLGAESFPGPLDDGQDLGVSGAQRFVVRGAVLGGQFHDGLAGDLQAFQGAFGGSELIGEMGDLITKPFGGIADGAWRGVKFACAH